MAAPLTNCIYCSGPFDSGAGKGDHVIPSILGEFSGDRRFRDICRVCNNGIGQCEQQLVSCAPEALYRRSVKPVTPLGRSDVLLRKGAHGGDAPQVKIPRGDYDERVRFDPENPHNVLPLNQIIFEWDDGHKEHIELAPNISIEGLKKKMSRFESRAPSKARLICTESRVAHYSSLLQTIWPTCTFRDTVIEPAGSRVEDCQVRIAVTSRTFRAIAKIGFHYYLLHTRRGFSGDEQCFAAIRGFIMKGEGVPEQFVSQGQLTMWDAGEKWIAECVPSNALYHVLALEETTASLIAYVHLFRGDGGNANAYKVSLANPTHNVLVLVPYRAHAFIYHWPQPDHGRAGRVAEFPIRTLQ